MKIFVHPLYRFETLDSVEKQQPRQLLSLKPFDRSKLYNIFSSLESAMAQACHIYNLTHLASSVQSTRERTVSSDLLNPLLDRLEMTIKEIPPFTPGENSLVWILFVAASKSIRLEHAAFFTSRLRELMPRVGYDDRREIFLDSSIMYNLTAIVFIPIMFSYSELK